MTSRLASAAVMVGFVLAAAILQVLATIKLGLAPLEALARVSGQGGAAYVWAAAATACAALGAWLLRHRLWLSAGWVALIVLPLVILLRGRVSLLGWAYHGEYILHHFATVLSAAASLVLLDGWRRRSNWGPFRFAPLALLSLGVLGAVGVHIAGTPVVNATHLEGPMAWSTAIAVGGLICAVLVTWPHTHPPKLRTAAALLIGIVVLRIVLAGGAGLHGGMVPEGRRTLLMAAVVVNALALWTIFRPEAPRSVRTLVLLLSALATGMLVVMYKRSFGLLEDGIGGLAQSLIAFPLPYPEYVAPWRVYVVCSGFFFMFMTVFSGLMSYEERVRGIALGLLLVTGLGLTHPQLVLMLIAGHLLWLESLVPASPVRPMAPSIDAERLLTELAQQLGVPAPIAVADGRGRMVALRIDGVDHPVDLRARSGRRGAWTLRLRVGMLGRGGPSVELFPDAGTRGERPTHAIQRTHRVRGEARALEQVSDATLDALMPFERAVVKFWAAGAEVDFGNDLSRLDGDRLHALVTAFSDERGS